MAFSYERGTPEGTVIDSGLRDATHDKTMSKGHRPRVVYHQVYNVYQDYHTFPGDAGQGLATCRSAATRLSAPRRFARHHRGTFFLFITLQPRVEWCKRLLALNTSPPRDRFTIMRSWCSQIRAHKNSAPLGPYSGNMPRALWWS